MPFFKTITGYQGYADQSAFTEELANRILEKKSRESFNPGQQAIAKNTRFYAFVVNDWTIDFAGILKFYESKVSSYYFRIDCPHPDAISETINYIEEEVRDIIYNMFENTYTSFVGDGISDIEEIERENISYIYNKVGVFV